MMFAQDFYFVYRAIEDALDSCRDEEHIFPLRDPRMYRSAALEQDVTFFLGENWTERVDPSPPTKKVSSSALILGYHLNFSFIHIGRVAW